MFLYRNPAPGDAEGIARVLWESWETTYSRWLSDEWFATVSAGNWANGWRGQLKEAERLRDAGEPDPVERWVALDGDEIVGVALAGPATERGMYAPVHERALTIMYVDAAHHGTGIAHELLNRALPDDRPAELWVADPNPRAQAFYRKHGFETDGSRQINERLASIPEIRMVR